MPLSLKSYHSTECLSYEIQQQQGGVFQLQIPFCTDTLRPVLKPSTSATSVSDLIDQFDDLLACSKTLEDARYLPDIPVKTVQQRINPGLPLRSRVWPNPGDRLEPLPTKTPGLHFPFAYVADERFGAVFNCHREGYDLHSINFLHVGRKIWLVIPASHCTALEEQFRKTKGYQRQFQCDQVLRHHQVSFTRGQCNGVESEAIRLEGGM